MSILFISHRLTYKNSQAKKNIKKNMVLFEGTLFKLKLSFLMFLQFNF
jgi:hypothetical protein